VISPVIFCGKSPQFSDLNMMQEFNTIDFRAVPLLSRRIGQRYGFASVGVSPTEIALLGGSVHFEFSSSQTAASKGDIGRGNPVPFSQVHCIDKIFQCSLLTISSKELPCARLYHSAARLGTGGDIVVFGGQAFNDKRKLADIWTLSLTKNQDSTWHGVWRELPPASRSTAFPPPRSKHAVTTMGNNTIVVSGGSGFEDSLLADLWIAQIDHSGVVWKKINCPTGRVPPARKSHALSPMVSETELLLHGGVDAQGTQLSDLWICQFMNEERSRCAWTQLVSAPFPRSGGLILIPKIDLEEKSVLVFGGNQPNAMKYRLDTGEWSVCPFVEGTGHAFVASELAVDYPLDDSMVSVPSVLLLPDTVLRASPCDPWLASVFPVNPKNELDAKNNSNQPEKLTNVDLEISRNQRRFEYRLLADQLPCLVPGITETTDSNTLMAIDSMGSLLSKSEKISASIPQSPMFVVDYLVTGLLETGVSISSWSSCHILATAGRSGIDTIEGLKQFVSSPETIQTINDAANSCVIVVNRRDGDKLIAFVSEALNRHSLSSKLAFPVISLKRTNYAQVQATLRLMMTYTPFRSPGALEELFALFSDKGAGFLLIDFDGESDNKSPLLSHYRPVVAKDSTSFWSECLECLMHARPRVEQYALTLLDSTEMAVNGHQPSQSLKAVFKSKLLQSGKEVSLGRFGSMVVGKLKSGPNVGVLLYCDGVFIRHLKGRFPVEANEPEEELEEAVMNVTGIVELASNVFTPVHGALSDFQEAIANSSDWTQFVHKVQEACLSYN